MLSVVLALLAGTLIGASLGALGSGGSILAVPVLAYLLGQSPAQATTGSLVVVGVTSLIAAVAAHRAGHVLPGRGVAFGGVAIIGAAGGALGAGRVPEPVLMASFAVLLALVAGLMAVRQVRSRRAEPVGDSMERSGPAFDDPIITFSPTFACACPRAVKVLVTATLVGILTGFLGVGGGFLVVPALVLALAVPLRHAAGTSLVVITMTSAVALVVRVASGAPRPDWVVVGVLTAAAVAGALAGARLAAGLDQRRLSLAFTGLVLAVAGYTAFQVLPA